MRSAPAASPSALSDRASRRLCRSVVFTRRTGEGAAGTPGVVLDGRRLNEAKRFSQGLALRLTAGPYLLIVASSQPLAVQ